MRERLRERLVVIGNGMAGMRTVEELLKIAPHKYHITVFGAEPYGNYNRIMLSPVLSGEKTIEQIMINTLDWYKENDITLHAGETKKIVNIDRHKQKVISADGTEAQYDRLLLSTGSKPYIIPLPGNDLDGVIAFRDIADVKTMLKASKEKKRAIVIGGGLLGLEAASGLIKQGMDVTVIHNIDVLMNRQLDQPSSNLLAQSLIARGLKFKMNATSSELKADEHGHVKSIIFSDGEELPAELVVMAVGIRPNIELALKAGLHCEQGIVVSDTLQTFDPKIYAVGECIQHRKELFGMVAPIWDQAKVVANHLAGHGTGIYRTQANSTKLKVSGIDLFSVGDFTGDDSSEELIFQDPKRGIYKKVVLKEDQIIGSVMYGDTIASSWYYQLMKEGSKVSSIRDSLLFGHLGNNIYDSEA
jgi:nitrite reductase (NADH) large subunit